MRDLQKIWIVIVSAAWSALAQRAISEVSVGDDDEPSRELDPLSERVLRALATRMEGVGDFEELLSEIAESSHNTEKRRISIPRSKSPFTESAILMGLLTPLRIRGGPDERVEITVREGWPKHGTRACSA